jgi:competence protein ComEA
MKYHLLFVVLTVAVLLLSTGRTSAIENNTDALQETKTKVEASQESAKFEINAEHKYPAKITLIDINSATKEELKKLPGISSTEADKIIANRPFGSKVWLVTNKIIPMETYQAVKGLVICKLTKKDIDIIKSQTTHQNKK